MNLDYTDFDFNKFEKEITDYLIDCDVIVDEIRIISKEDKYGWDVEIDIENEENLPSRLHGKYCEDFIFDTMYTTNCLFLKMPIVRAKQIAEEFSPKTLKVEDDAMLIGDKNSDVEIWVNVWYEEDDGEEYPLWDFNKESFNLNKYEDLLERYLQQDENVFYAIDGEVADTF